MAAEEARTGPELSKGPPIGAPPLRASDALDDGEDAPVGLPPIVSSARIGMAGLIMAHNVRTDASGLW